MDFMFNLTPGDIDYDIETFPNMFCVGFLHRCTKQRWYFEISFRRNDIEQLCLFIERCRDCGCRWVGFNNIGFDYPVMHYIYKLRYASASVSDIYEKAMSIINAPFNARFAHMVWESEWLVPQIDLYKIHHFDNPSKATSLKILEFNMGMSSIEDLPFDVGLHLNNEQADILKSYMWHDITATDMFADRTQGMLELREGLSKTFNCNMTNMSDVKMGEVILVTELEKAGIKCFEYVDNKKKKRQTKRESINLAEVIFPYVKFERHEFMRIHEYFKSKVITETKGVFKGLIAAVEGVEYKFGTGGIHASIESQVVHSNDTHQIVDVDVASFYPQMGIKNKLYPAHLGAEFCEAYEGIYQTRKKYPKKTHPAENGAFKLALNGAYGGSNNEYSPFLDPFYTMSITINGQLLLCMLTEQMLKVPGLKMIQANTDGITYLCPREYLNHTRSICRWWEQLTSLELEEVLYSRMFIRDVNNYAAEYESGDMKRIGAYAYVTDEVEPGTRELPHHKDWSAIVVAKAAEAALVHGKDIREFVTSHDNVMEFMLRTKVPRSSALEWGGEPVQNVVRYYVSTDGDVLEKVMPPAGPIGAYKRANKLTDEFYYNVVRELTGEEPLLESFDWSTVPWDERIHTKNQTRYEERRSGINTGWTVQLCNKMDDLLVPPDGGSPMCDINYEWYIKEAEKLVKPLLN